MVSLILVFNSFLLWMLVTVSVEWARSRTASLSGFLATAVGVITNPIVASIVAGTAFGYTGVPLPAMIDRTLELIGQAAVPLSLIALGMGLAEFGIREGIRESAAICTMKLLVHPLLVITSYSIHYTKLYDSSMNSAPLVTAWLNRWTIDAVSPVTESNEMPSVM